MARPGEHPRSPFRGARDSQPGRSSPTLWLGFSGCIQVVQLACGIPARTSNDRSFCYDGAGNRTSHTTRTGDARTYVYDARTGSCGSRRSRPAVSSSVSRALCPLARVALKLQYRECRTSGRFGSTLARTAASLLRGGSEGFAMQRPETVSGSASRGCAWATLVTHTPSARACRSFVSLLVRAFASTSAARENRS